MTNFWTRPNSKHSQMTIQILVFSVFDSAENIVGKGENAGYQFLFSQCFLKPSSLKVGIVW